MRMEAEEIIDMQNSLHKFSVSWVTIHLLASPVAAFISAWNSHTIPGRNGGIPDMLPTRSCCISPLPLPLPLSHVPSVHEAVNLHESTIGRLTRESTYGVDPLELHPELQQLRERDFLNAFPDVLHNNDASSHFRFYIFTVFCVLLCIK